MWHRNGRSRTYTFDNQIRTLSFKCSAREKNDNRVVKCAGRARIMHNNETTNLVEIKRTKRCTNSLDHCDLEDNLNNLIIDELIPMLRLNRRALVHKISK